MMLFFGSDIPAIVSHFSSKNSMNGHGNYTSHLSLLGKADNCPGVGVRGFLDILIAVKKKKKEKKRWEALEGDGGKSCHVICSVLALLAHCKYFLPTPQAQLGNQEQQNQSVLAKYMNGALSPTTRCRSPC